MQGHLLSRVLRHDRNNNKFKVKGSTSSTMAKRTVRTGTNYTVAGRGLCSDGVFGAGLWFLKSGRGSVMFDM